MNSLRELKQKISQIPTDISTQIDSRLQEFNSFKDKSEEEWFSELCFCLLTANAKASTALNLQSSLGPSGFLTLSKSKLVEAIKSHKHRFHNNKSKYIIKARTHATIKRTIQSLVSSKDDRAAREWLVENIQGLGYKESSHFLRNTGHTNVAIIDRHILRLLEEMSLIQTPQTISKSKYLDIEEVCWQLAQELNVNLAKLDLQLWYLQTGKVLK